MSITLIVFLMYFRMSLDTEFAGDKGWEHDFVFYVPPSNPEVLVPISVGYNDDDWTYKVRQGNANTFTEQAGGSS